MESIVCTGAIKKSETCNNCYVDVASGVLVSTCSTHKPVAQMVKRVNDKKLNLELPLGVKP